MRRKTKPKPSPADIYAGNKLRIRRCLLGMSQQKLGQRCGVSFQQIQKYENGKNRISAGRLYEFSIILDVPLDYFFWGYDKDEVAKGG